MTLCDPHWISHSHSLPANLSRSARTTLTVRLPPVLTFSRPTSTISPTCAQQAGSHAFRVDCVSGTGKHEACLHGCQAKPALAERSVQVLSFATTTCLHAACISAPTEQLSSVENRSFCCLMGLPLMETMMSPSLRAPNISRRVPRMPVVRCVRCVCFEGAEHEAAAGVLDFGWASQKISLPA